MDPSEQSRFDNLYRCHLRMLKLQGKSDTTIDAYARAVRRVTTHFDCCPDQLTLEQWGKATGRVEGRFNNFRFGLSVPVPFV
jgi:hypothetical protein